MTNKELALSLASHGFYIFPCREKPGEPYTTKKGELVTPEVKSPYWHRVDLLNGQDNATQETAQIKAWWARWPGAYVGVVLDVSGAFAVDIDRHPDKPDGLESWKILLKQNGGQRPAIGPAQKTLSGGYHLLFKASPGMALPGQLAPGVDIKHAGYVCTGQPGYQILEGHGWECALPAAPDWMLQLFEQRNRKELERPLPSGEADPGDVAAYWLDRYTSEAAPGRRNGTGFLLAQQLRDLGLSQQAAEPYMLQYAQKVPQVPSDRYTDAAALASLKQAFRRGRREPAIPAQFFRTAQEAGESVNDAPMQEPPAPEAPPPEGTTEAPPTSDIRHKSTWCADELIRTEFSEPRYAVPGLIPEGLTIIGGRPKVGKTWMGNQLGLAVDTGGMFLGRQVEAGGVLYLALEDSARRLKMRLIKQKAPASTKIRYELRWKPLQEGGLDDLLIELVRADLRLIVIDTLTRALPGLDQNRDSARVGQILGDLQHMAIIHNTAIVIIDHTRKPGNLEPNPIDDIMNTSNKSGAADAVMAIYKARGKKGAQFMGVGREIEEFDVPIIFDTDLFCWQPAGETSAKEDILGYLHTMKRAQLRDVAEGVGRNRSNVYKDLADLWTSGKIGKEEEGRFTFWITL